MAPPSAFRRPLRAWYATHGRHDLPWRLTRDPYAVLVSEVMLQQTQVERVVPYYDDWLARWPSVFHAACAAPADAIDAWAGLGYNRRAVNLHRACVAAAEAGRVPATVGELLRLPGVGPYTARAVASFAGARPVAVVEANTGRVLARAVHGRASARDVTNAVLQSSADAVLPRSGEAARDHNLALMDLGATVCTSRRPGCDGCPLRPSCAWLAAGRPPSPADPRPAPRFEDTARFARGRLIAALRTAPSLTAPELAQRLPAQHRDRVPQHLRALAADRLVECRDGRWSLPGRQSTSIASPKL